MRAGQAGQGEWGAGGQRSVSVKAGGLGRHRLASLPLGLLLMYASKLVSQCPFLPFFLGYVQAQHAEPAAGQQEPLPVQR